MTGPWLFALGLYLTVAFVVALLFTRRLPEPVTLNNPMRAAVVTLAPLWLPGLVAYYVVAVIEDVAARVGREPVRTDGGAVPRVPGDGPADGTDGQGDAVPGDGEGAGGVAGT